MRERSLVVIHNLTNIFVLSLLRCKINFLNHAKKKAIQDLRAQQKHNRVLRQSTSIKQNQERCFSSLTLALILNSIGDLDSFLFVPLVFKH